MMNCTGHASRVASLDGLDCGLARRVHTATTRPFDQWLPGRTDGSLRWRASHYPLYRLTGTEPVGLADAVDQRHLI